MSGVLRLGSFGCAAVLHMGCSLFSLDALQDGAGGSSSGGSSIGGSSAGGADVGGSSGGSTSTTNTTSTTTSATSGGAGGAGGGPTATPPFDWTPSLTATWRFESTAMPGTDDGPGHLNLQVSAGAPLSSTESVEGSHALSLAGGATMSSGADVFGTDGSLTFGGWFNTSAVESEGLMGRKASGHGYLMEHLGGSQSGKCFWESNGSLTLAEAPANVWPPGAWIHFVCRYNASTTALSAMLRGAPVAFVSAPLSVAPTSFSLGYPDLPYEGLIDEAFFVDRALTDADVLRIFACGIDGKGCTCADGDPEAYASCGRTNPVCNGLPACNAATPEG